jgi:hypothetical protein
LNEAAIIMDFRKKFLVSPGGKITLAGIDPTAAPGWPISVERTNLL